MCILSVTMSFFACADEEWTGENAAESSEYIRFGTTRERAISRSEGLSIMNFDTGTKYDLYAITTGTQYWNATGDDAPRLRNVTGTETADHTVDYGTEVLYDQKTLDFYAVTDGTTTAPVAVLGEENSTTGPTYAISERADGYLPDLMRAETREHSSENGVVTLDFKHVLTKLTFEVVKVKELADTEVTLTSVEILNAYKAGTLDLGTGKVTASASDGDKGTRTVFSGKTYAVPASTPELLTDTILIFPREESIEALNIRLKLNKGGVEITKDYPIMQAKKLADGSYSATETEPFVFRPNYAYRLSITVLKDNVQVLTVAPMVYDWVEHVDEELYLGQPHTFGGLIWMDRYLGAESADISTPESWEKCRGYYYQFGRSIPYTLDNENNKGRMVEFTGSDDKTYSRPKYDSSKEKEGAQPYPNVPGREDEGPLDSYQGAKAAISLEEAMNTTMKFNFIQNAHLWDGNNTRGSDKYWATLDNQPCPAGWRLPTVEDFYTIFPYDAAAGDVTFNTGLYDDGTNGLQGKKNRSDYHKGSTFTEIRQNDPVAGRKSVYVGVKGSGDLNAADGVLYAIKNQGSSQAYRLKWYFRRIEGDTEDLDSGTGVAYRTTLVVARFPCAESAEMDSTNYDKFDWKHPVEEMYFPITGHIYGTNKALIALGVELTLATSESSSNSRCCAARVKYAGSNTGRYIYVRKTDYRDNGFQIRCVRDVK